MIETEAEYEDTKKQVAGLQAFLDSLNGPTLPPDAPKRMADPKYRALYEDGTRSMLEQFQVEVAQFEAANSQRSHLAMPEKVLQAAK